MSAILNSNLLLFRMMTEQDLTEVMQIESCAYDYPWTEGIFRDCMRVGYLCEVLLLEDQHVGYTVMSVAAGESHLLNICVSKHYQKRGFGRELMAHAMDNAKRLNASICFLEVRTSNQPAVGLYHSMGFNQVGVRKDYYPAENHREDALIFALQL